jgi:tRNA (guanine37-N1)-methyltransferase
MGFTVRARCAVVTRGEGESARKKLSEAGLLRADLCIKSDEKSVFIPVLVGAPTGFPESEEEFELAALKIKSYKELADVPDALKELLPSSFDIVGDVAVFKLPAELAPHAEAIGRALLAANKNIKSAALDEGVEGDFRIRRIRVVAGRVETRTAHKEYGVSLAVDPAKVYFSPRLAGERWRVAQLVEPGEGVLDMFAGVGPFSILIAKKGRPKSVRAIDLNECAVEMLRENAQANKVHVDAHLGDARKLAPKLGPADRVIMNLPHSAHEFLPTAMQAAAPGAWLHIYQVVGKGSEEGRARELEALAPGTTCWSWKVVHPYSPGSAVIVYDLRTARD